MTTKKESPSPNNGPKSGWAIGIQGGGLSPMCVEEGFFRGLNTIQVKTKDGPRPMLSTADILSTESGSSMGITALSYSKTPRHQLLRMDRVVVDHNLETVDKYPVTQYNIPGKIGGLSLHDVPHTAMCYAQTDEGFVEILEHYSAPSLLLKIPALLSALCLPRSTFVDGDTNLIFGSIMNGILSLMGVDPSKRTASNHEAVKDAVNNSGGSLEVNDFVTIQTLDGKSDGPLPPLPYINFAMLGPASGGSSVFRDLLQDRGSNYKNLMLDLNDAYSGTLLEPFEDGYILHASKLNSDELKKLRYEEYEGVTQLLFTATPDSVESMYRAGTVPAHKKLGGWVELPFKPFSVPSVEFNKGQFSVLQTVKAGTDFIPGSLVSNIVSYLVTKVSLLKLCAPCITNNANNSTMLSFSGWPDGDQSKSPTKMLFYDAGYFMPSTIAPLLARGYSKIMKQIVFPGVKTVVMDILFLFGLGINASPKGVVEIVEKFPTSLPGAFTTTFEAGDDLMDVSKDIRVLFGLNIVQKDGSTKPIKKLPNIAVLALEDLYEQYKHNTELGVAAVYVFPSKSYRNKYELKVASNDFHGLPAFPNQKATLIFVQSYDPPKNWKGKCNVNVPSKPGIFDFNVSAYQVNYYSDQACWSVLSQRKKIAEFLDLQIIE
mmetsp:Transcript_53930/g.62283  ORF Transcript_53930/g.62283 Transcript_53930/m.62283 type:complete len:657 (+) Transcript_53930:19-1989(+)